MTHDLAHDLDLATRIAAARGWVRGRGTHGTQRHHREPYWLNTLGQPITLNRLFEIAGYEENVV